MPRRLRGLPIPCALLLGSLVLSIVGCGWDARDSDGLDAAEVSVTVDAPASRSDVVAVFIRLTPDSGAAPTEGWATRVHGTWSTVFSRLPAGDYRAYARAVDAGSATLFETASPDTPLTLVARRTVELMLVLNEVNPPPGPSNAAPYLTSLTAQVVETDAGPSVILAATALDRDPADVLTFSWSSSAGSFGAADDAAHRSQITWTPPAPGSFAIAVTVRDDHGASARLAVNVVVSDTGAVVVVIALNSAPRVAGVFTTGGQIAVGQPAQLSALATDADHDPLSFAWSSDCDGGFTPTEIADEGDATRASSRFTPTARPASDRCAITVTARDDRGGTGQGTLTLTWFDAPIDTSPEIALQVSQIELLPNDAPEIRVVPRDGAGHPQWSYAFSDGRSGPTAGSFVPLVAGDPSAQVYTPALCVLQGGGLQTLEVSVVVTDPATGLTGSADVALTLHCAEPTFYTTKTPYRAQQDPASYEAPPAGFAPVFTELVARHGSRGLSSAKYDLAMYAIWQRALADGALTPLGQALGPDVLRVIRANALLDVGVPGIRTPGYGNLTQIGIREHQDLARRLIARLPDYFAALPASGRSIQVVSSGVDRAVDSAGFFAGSLATEQPSLGALLVAPPAPVGYPANAPVVQPDGANRFTLYFHKLVPKTDLVSSPADPYYAVYRDSQAYQAYANDADMNAKVASILATPTARVAARAVLERLFTPAFVDKLDDQTYTFANTGSFTFTSDDGSFVTTITGDGKTTVTSPTDAVAMLYNLYVIAPAMADELGGSLDAYVPIEQARIFAYLQDAQDFYQMGPSLAEKAPVTTQLAEALADDLFHEVDAIVAGDLSHGAKLRFTHAEIIVPLAGFLGLADAPVPQAQTYEYATSRWRGELIAPLAANLQWDVYRNAVGAVIVRMLYNEREIGFKPACDAARIAYRSQFYDYEALKTCYGR